MLSLIAVTLFVVFLAASPLSAQEKVIVSYDGNSGFQAAIWTALEREGFFKNLTTRSAAR